MALTTFTSGQILTAAQMNAVQANDYNQTVSTKTASYTLVAADKGTRVVMNSASATTITVNTSLFNAGDTLFLQNISTGVCTLTAGTATVSTAGSLAIPQNGSGVLYFTSAGVSIYYPSAVTTTPSALTLISATTIGTTVSSVTVSSAFSATYDYYKVVVIGGVMSTSTNIKLTFGATATGYYAFVARGLATGTTDFTGDNNATSFTRAGAGSTNSVFMDVNIGDPFATKLTKIDATLITLSTTGSYGKVAGFLNDSTSYTAFTITPDGGTMTGGAVYVYGYAKSQGYMTYKIQIDDLVRDATSDEAAAIETGHAEAEAQKQAEAAKLAARQAVLDKLGLTTDEAAALFGQFGNTGDVDRLRNNTR